MCGIFGALTRLTDEQLDGAAAAIHHRGPDSGGRYVDDHVSMVHARLRILDLSDAGAQPMRNDAGDVSLVFNGEIYNHRALRAQLESRFTFRSHSDTEVILHGYEAWGDAIIDKLDGMFAIGIWDARRRRLLLARDRCGKKPLYYTDSGTFRFGSTIRSILASGHPLEVDAQNIPFTLAYGFVPEPQTLYRGVKQLQPGQRLVVESNGTTAIDTWWAPSFGASESSDDFDTAAQRVRELLDAAVVRRLEADVPLGAFLSGGLDSTIIVSLMAKHLRRVETFSIGFSGDARYDETAYARIASKRFGTQHTEFTLEPSSFDLVDQLVREHEGPFGDSSAVPTHMVSKLTRASVTVAMTGDGGDELFCGYHRFIAAEASDLIPAPLRTAARIAASVLPARRERSLLGRVRKFTDAAALSLPERLARWNSFFPDVAAILNAETRATLGDAVDRPLEWQREVFAETHGRTRLSRILEHNFRTYLLSDLLVKADRSSMACALELRSPFLDTQLIAYASQLPSSYLRRGTRTKHVLRRAFADMVPHEILERGKMGFGVPLGAWFRNDLRTYLSDHLGDGARIHRYLDRRAVNDLLVGHTSGKADHGQRLWLLLTFELWLRQLERPS